ncbi:MAG TPA: trimethylamine methyltransferase family protein [Gammaproteobacteria bacterium]|nr:trimethylamine methyltransferase family protein [Gammaproteobacteria bacterium]
MARSRRRGARRQATENPVAIHQLDRKILRNRFRPLEALDEEQLEFIHEVSLRIVEEQGIEVLGDRALDLFRKSGAEVDDEGVVRMDRGLLLETVAQAPAAFDLVPRNPEQTLKVGGDVINFGLVSGAPNVHDNINGRRAGNFEDYRKLISFGQYFNVLTFFGNQATAPTDLPANSRHLDTTFVNLTVSDKAFFATGIGGGRARDAIEMSAIARGLTMEEMKSHPSVMTNINVNSPRKLDDSMAYGAMQMALFGQPVTVTPFTLMGAMTPATMAGALTQQNAEALVGIALLQLTRPGVPCIYGGFTSNVDMRSGSPAFGTPENSLANIAGGQLARRYDLPYRSSACNASNAVDAQATYETLMALWSAVMGHGNLIYHTAGWLEGGLVASFEKLIIDCEMLQHMSKMLEPIKIDLDEVGLEAMREVGPGGHFFGCGHTMERYKNAFYEPFVSDWQNSENWAIAGSKDATMRATELWPKVLEEFTPPPIDPAVREALEAYVAHRKEELGGGEPLLEPTE